MAISKIDLDLEPMPAPPSRKDWQIGISAPASSWPTSRSRPIARRAIPIAAIASRTEAHARAVAERHGIETVHASWEELLDDERVQVVDIAFPPDQQLEIVEAACRRSHIKGILAQKPVAANLAEAQRIVEVCANSDKTLAVNQNMRYDQSMRALKAALERGYLGKPVLATIEMRAIPHWQTFLEGTDRLTLANMSIHHLDVFRFLFGDPEGIFVSALQRPAHDIRAPRRDLPLHPRIRRRHARERVGRRVDGAGARRIRGRHLHQVARRGHRGPRLGHHRLALLPDARRRRTITFTTAQQPGYVFQPKWPEVWFPDAFQGTMGALFTALDGGENVLSGEGNLATMALIEAGYRSLDEKRLVRIDEITA